VLRRAHLEEAVLAGERRHSLIQGRNHLVVVGLRLLERLVLLLAQLDPLFYLIVDSAICQISDNKCNKFVEFLF
jgi:hypothetical protein